MTLTCIASDCGMPFDSTVTETRPATQLRGFWRRYCPKHRENPNGQTVVIVEKRTKLTHYVCGSGSHGCLYDNGPYACESLQMAVESLAETFELGRTRKARLKRDQYLELNPRRDGAEYCEITPCQCETPWEHNEDSESEEWNDYLKGEEND